MILFGYDRVGCDRIKVDKCGYYKYTIFIVCCLVFGRGVTYVFWTRKAAGWKLKESCRHPYDPYVIGDEINVIGKIP